MIPVVGTNAEVGDPTPADWQAWGAWVRARRETLGLTRKQAAARAGVSESTLRVLERGGQNRAGIWVPPDPADETLAAVARGLDLDPAEVFQRVARTPKPHLRLLPATGDAEQALLKARAAIDAALQALRDAR